MTIEPVQTAINEQNPWPGLDAYDEAGAQFFNGRSAEADELLRLVELSHLVALYGKSGLGKTSLLQAGLSPRLRAAHYLPVIVRLDFGQQALAPAEQLAQRFFAEMTKSEADFPPPDNGESLWRYLHRESLELWTRDNYPLTPVFILDQFEELFSLGGQSRERLKATQIELTSLLDNLEPPELARQAGRTARTGLDTSVHRYRCLISFREDFLPEFKEWSHDLPSLLKRELRLLPMRQEVAIQAVEESGKAIIAAGAARAIVEFVGNVDRADGREQSVEPVLLSLCCYRLNLMRGQAPIQPDMLKKFGERILEDFFRESLAGMPDNVSRFIEEHLIQGNRYRSSFPRDEAIAGGHISEAQLAHLCGGRHRLLCIVQEPDAERIELIHDRLVGVVSKARDERIQLESARHSALNERRRKRQVLLGGALIWTVVMLGMAIHFYMQANNERQLATNAARTATILRVAQEGAVLSPDERSERPERGPLSALAAFRLASPEQTQTRMSALTALERERLWFWPPAMQFAATASLISVAYSPPDGKLIATGGWDGKISLWDAATGARRHEWTTMVDAKYIMSVAFSPDGKYLASGGADAEIVLWNVADGQPTRFPKKHDKTISSLSFSADGKYLLSASWDRTLRLWDVAGANMLKAFPRKHNASITSAAISPDGKTIVSGSEDKTLQIWDLASGNHLGQLGEHSDWISAIAFLPDGTLVSASGDRTLQRWNVAQRRKIGEPLKGHSDWVSSVAASPDGKLIASGGGGNDKTVRLWDAGTGAAKWSPLVGHNASVRDVAFSLDSRRITSTGWDKVALTWDVNDRQEASENLPVQGLEGKAEGTAINADGSKVVVIESGVAKVIEPGTGLPGKSFVLDSGSAPLALALSADGGRLAMLSDGNLGLWDTTTGKKLFTVALGSKGSGALAFDAKGGFIASGDDEGGIKLWHTADGQAADEKVAKPSEEKTSDANESAGPRYAHAVSALALSQDGRWLAAGSKGGAIRLWDRSSGKLLGEALLDHEGPVKALAFSPDGNFLASGGFDKKIFIWTLASRKSLGKPLLGHTSAISSIAFAADGQHIISGELNGNVRRWPILEAWADNLCARLQRNMSRGEWSEWISKDEGKPDSIVPYTCQCPGQPVGADDKNPPTEHCPSPYRAIPVAVPAKP